MTRLFYVFVLLFISGIASANEMKLEGSCKGINADGKIISFTYFSGFNGCENLSKAGITFAGDTSQEGLFTGTRMIKNGEDKYTFTRKSEKAKPSVWLIFADTTGNTEGVFKHKDTTGKITSVTLQCEIRDYEYEECSR